MMRMWLSGMILGFAMGYIAFGIHIFGFDSMQWKEVLAFVALAAGISLLLAGHSRRLAKVGRS